MISSKHCAHIKFIEIATCWSKLVFTSIHHLSKDIFLESHSNSSHLCNCITSFNHMATPSIHYCFELRKILWCLIWISFWDWIISADIPKVSPLGIKWRGALSEWFIFIGVIFKGFSMIFSFLGELWSCTNLKIKFRINISNWSIVVMIFRPAIKESFHHIEKLGILRLFPPGIINHQTSIFM